MENGYQGFDLIISQMKSDKQSIVDVGKTSLERLEKSKVGKYAMVLVKKNFNIKQNLLQC